MSFVGRIAERAVIAEALAKPDAAVIFIHGPGGIGKSALLAEFAAESRVVIVDDSSDPAEFAISARKAWAFPADAVVLFASRAALSAGQRYAAGWPARVEVLRLGPLSPEDIHEYGADVARLSQGYPLAMRLLADLAADEPGSLPQLELAENMPLVRQLLDGIVGPVPSADHRRALQLATLVRHTTEDLLSGVFRADAHGLFEWLRRQPYILEGDHGLAPDELVRELVEIDLRWRDRLGYAELQRRATSQLLKRIAAHTHDVDAVLRDVDELMSLQRHRVALPARSSQPGIRHVNTSFATLPAEIRRHVDTHGPLRDDEHVGVTMLESADQLVAAMATAALDAHRSPRVAWDFVILADTSRPDLVALLDLHSINESDHLFGHDWRRLGPAAWLRKITDQPWNGPIPEVTGVGGQLLADEAVFTRAVRAALRDLKYDRRLAANPLINSRLVQASVGELPPEKRLRELIQSSANTLRKSDPALYRIIDRVYLRPSVPQQRVAEAMNLPFTTFRRWRNKAIGRIAANLWEREVGTRR